LEADGQRVAIDTRGPRAADCACRSVAVCRHRLAAVIFLRDQGDGAAAVAETADATDAADANPAEIVADMAMDQLQKWAGKAGWRAALESVAGVTGIEATATAIAVYFADSDEPVRILKGQGFDGIVSKVSKARVKAYHAAAILAARQHFGIAIPDAASEGDAEGADDDAGATVSIDPAFLARVSASLCEVAALGLNLAPLPLEESLFELSVSSRADSLPRLAALLRAIAAQIRLRRARGLDFDPDRLLELAATAFALTRALAGGDRERQTGLAGKVRRDFAPVEPLHLVGCGGERWTSATGARGVTAWFIEPESGRWLSTTLARGAGQDPAFVPSEAWRSQPLWQAAPLAVLAHARITLSGSRRSADDRLSAPASAKAIITEKAVRADPDWPGVVRCWQEIASIWRNEAGLGLNANEQPAALIIYPSLIAPPYFDDLTQQLIWPVADADGQWLALTLDHDGGASTAIQALEANVRSGWKGMILVRIERYGYRLSLRPITLFAEENPIDLSLWQPPWHRPRQEPSAVSNWQTRLRPSQARRFSVVQRNATEVAVVNAWRHLLDRAVVGPSLARTLDDQLIAHADQLESYGLARLGALLRQAHDGAGLLLAAYGLIVARQQGVMLPLLR
jgi:hypothetical protein